LEVGQEGGGGQGEGQGEEAGEGDVAEAGEVKGGVGGLGAGVGFAEVMAESGTVLKVQLRFLEAVGKRGKAGWDTYFL